MIPDLVAAPAVIRVPPGRFMMGATADDKFATDTERPTHSVMIVRPFSLGRCPVTVGEYRAFAPAHAPEEDPDWPVVGVSWDDARMYCSWLRAETGRAFRLPTEAEWEYACRAGTIAPFETGDEISTDRANFLYAEHGERIGLGRRTPVGGYPPNSFGLHDLHGNVCEWVEDLWHPDYAGAPADGSTWLAADGSGPRVIRGGAWDYLPRLLRSAWRDSLPPTRRRDNVGFRVAASLGA
jgi:formylglycine-generating enzyme required for sulfatase activity